ncbi:Lipoprotein OS=Streptomyces rimosus subsp. rimosus (strain ATCC / DSM 40260 / JCM 4667/ NRRL 2234) OX=1265868 GN=SRIM_026960 PE=4 SV=1 [Streptomyces rimosus subsp. rimosus]
MTTYPSAGPVRACSRRPAASHRRRGAALTAAVCAVLAGALAGCAAEDPDAGTNGVGKLPADQIQTKAQTAARGAGTVRLAGDLVSQGRTYKLDMRLGQNGAQGQLSTKAATFQLLRVGDALYLKANAGFWEREKGAAPSKNDGTAASKLIGKYVKVPASDPVYKRFSGFTDKSTLLSSLLGLHGKLTAGERGAVDGTRTIRIAAAQGSGGTLDVSLEGKPYPLRLRRAGGAGEVRLTDWGKPVDLRAPAADQVIDYGKSITIGD